MMISCENAAKPSFLVLFIERVLTVIPSYASFAGVGCIRDAAVLEVNWNTIASLNVSDQA